MGNQRLAQLLGAIGVEALVDEIERRCVGVMPAVIHFDLMLEEHHAVGLDGGE